MFLLTLANAGTQTAALSDLRTAVMLKLCEASAAWCGTSNSRPASAAVKVQAGLPKLQGVALVGDWLRPGGPKKTRPADTTCASSVVLLAPEAMLKFAPEG